MADLATLDPYKRGDIQLAGRMLRTFTQNEDILESILVWLFQGFAL